MADLFEPVDIGAVHLRNRVMMAPMSMNSAQLGEMTEWHLVHYGARAMGGCGLLMLEDTAVEQAGRVSSLAVCLSEPRHARALERVVQFCKQQGASVGVQLAHAGRKALRDKKGKDAGAIGPAGEPFDRGWALPIPATEGDLGRVKDAFAQAAKLARDAGVDVVEVHAAHGYLLHSFLSPVTNIREDDFGGSLKGRSRLLIEVTRAVADTVGEMPIFVRLPASDGCDGGLEVQDVITIAGELRGVGVELIDIGGSGIVPQVREPSADVQQGCANMVRKSCEMRVAAGGGIENARDALQTLLAGNCDLVTVGRPLLSDPYWVVRAAAELGGPNLLPEQYPVRVAGSTTPALDQPAVTGGDGVAMGAVERTRGR